MILSHAMSDQGCRSENDDFAFSAHKHLEMDPGQTALAAIKDFIKDTSTGSSQ
jgi:hypothetical protein